MKNKTNKFNYSLSKTKGWLDTFDNSGIITTNDTIYDENTLKKYSKNGILPKYVVKTTNKVPYNVKKTTLAKPIEEEGMLSKGLNVLDDVMSAPQRAAVYALTGKYQNPSEALGIKNKWGAMATDMLLDPMNLLGVSAISKGLSRVGGKVLNKVAGTTAEHLDEFAKLADKAPLDLHNPKIKTKSVYQPDVAEALKDMLREATDTYKDSYKSIYGNSRLNYPKEFWNKYDNVLKNVYKDIPIEQARNKFLELSKTGVGTALINDLINQSKDKNGNIVNNETKYATSESFKPVFDTPKPKVKFNKVLTTIPVKQEVTKQVEQPKIETSQEYTKTPTKQSIDYTFNGEYIPSDTPNVPNVKTLKDRKTNKPMFFINQAGDKIPYDRELKGITKEFQYKKKLGGWLDKLN